MRACASFGRPSVRACVVDANGFFKVCLSDEDAGQGGYVSRHIVCDIPTPARSVTRVHERVCRDACIRHHCAEVSATPPAREIVHDESWRFNVVVKYENNKDGELMKYN